MSDVSFGQRGLEQAQPKISNWDVRHRRAEQEARLLENLTKIQRSQHATPSSLENSASPVSRDDGSLSTTGWFFHSLGASLVAVTVAALYMVAFQASHVGPRPGQGGLNFRIDYTWDGLLPHLVILTALTIYLMSQVGRRAANVGLTRSAGVLVAAVCFIGGVSVIIAGHLFQGLFVILGVHIVGCVLPTAMMSESVPTLSPLRRMGWFLSTINATMVACLASLANAGSNMPNTPGSYNLTLFPTDPFAYFAYSEFLQQALWLMVPIAVVFQGVMLFQFIRRMASAGYGPVPAVAFYGAMVALSGYLTVAGYGQAAYFVGALVLLVGCLPRARKA